MEEKYFLSDAKILHVISPSPAQLLREFLKKCQSFNIDVLRFLLLTLHLLN